MEFKFDLFKEDDQAIIRSLIERGEFSLIASAIIIETKEQELALAEFLASKVQPKIYEESKVEQELKELRIKTNLEPIQTPEDEKLWQQKLDEERAAFEKKAQAAKQKEIKVLKTETKEDKRKSRDTSDLQTDI